MSTVTIPHDVYHAIEKYAHAYHEYQISQGLTGLDPAMAAHTALLDTIEAALTAARHAGTQATEQCTTGCGQPVDVIVDADHAYCATCALPVIEFLSPRHEVQQH